MSTIKVTPEEELVFNGPFDKAVSAILKVKNEDLHKHLAYKIKTTVPKLYCVKPNSGVLKPHEEVEVSVILQPFDYDSSTKYRHKFLVQSVFAPDGEFVLETLWKESDPSTFVDIKLRCVLNGNGVMPTTESTAKTSSSNPPLTSQSSSVIRDQQRTSSQEMKRSEGSGGDGGVNVKTLLEKENVQLKEEVLKLQQEMSRVMVNQKKQKQDGRSCSSGVKDHQGSGGQMITSIPVTSPEANTLSTFTIYMAIFILVIGFIMGKYVF